MKKSTDCNKSVKSYLIVAQHYLVRTDCIQRMIKKYSNPLTIDQISIVLIVALSLFTIGFDHSKNYIFFKEAKCIYHPIYILSYVIMSV